MRLCAVTINPIDHPLSLGPENFTGQEEWARVPEGAWGAPRDTNAPRIRPAIRRTLTHPARHSTDAWKASVKHTMQAIMLLEEDQREGIALKMGRLENTIDPDVPCAV